MGPTGIFHDLETAREALSNPVVTIGNFDGVHLGHQTIFEWVVDAAEERSAPSIALTFVPHPVRYFKPDTEEFRLTTDAEKFRLIEEAGLDAIVALTFDGHVASLEPDEFVAHILHEGLGAAAVAVGANFRFGQGRAGTTDDLKRLADDHGIDSKIFSEVTVDDRPVSSTRIRDALREGRVSEASSLLGRPYRLSGTVVRGEQRGRELGYPTANIEAEHLVPGHGIYATNLILDGTSYPAATSIGVRPVFEGTNRTVEAYVLDAPSDFDIYDRDVQLDFHAYIRDERDFESSEALVRQMDRDIKDVRQALNA
jgi:riboflavin kinase/FMN adenylyltransferase